MANEEGPRLLIDTSIWLEYLHDQVLDDLLRENGVSRIVLSGRQMKRTVGAMDDFDLDFDDAYQYVATKSRDLKLVSFDTDFDRTDLKRLEPADVLDQSA